MAEKKPTTTTRLKAERIQGKLKSERVQSQLRPERIGSPLSVRSSSPSGCSHG